MKTIDAWIEKEEKTNEIIENILSMESYQNIEGFTTEQTNIIKALAYRLSTINKSSSWPLDGHDAGFKHRYSINRY